MKLEKIDVSKERKTVKNKIIKVNDANKGRVSRTTLTKRNDIKKSRNRSNRRKKIFFKDIT